MKAREQRTVAAFADAFIAGENEVLTPEQVAENIATLIAAMRSKRLRSLGRAAVGDRVPAPAHGRAAGLLAHVAAPPGAA